MRQWTQPTSGRVKRAREASPVHPPSFDTCKSALPLVASACGRPLKLRAFRYRRRAFSQPIDARWRALRAFRREPVLHGLRGPWTHVVRCAWRHRARDDGTRVGGAHGILHLLATACGVTSSADGGRQCDVRAARTLHHGSGHGDGGGTLDVATFSSANGASRRVSFADADRDDRSGRTRGAPCAALTPATAIRR